jgi:hypothetical protein
MQCDLQVCAVPCSALLFFRPLAARITRVGCSGRGSRKQDRDVVLWPIGPHLPLGYEFPRMSKVLLVQLGVSTDSGGFALGTARCGKKHSQAASHQ